MIFDNRIGECLPASCRDKGWTWSRVGAWCLSCWPDEWSGLREANRSHPHEDKHKAPLIHPTQPLVPTGCRTHLPRFGRHHSSGGGAASVPMGMITPFSWQNSLGLDLAGDEELSRSFKPCLNNQNRYCHPERSEASLCPSSQTLRGVSPERSEWAQGDNT